MDLIPFFDALNDLHFDGMLECPILKWNARLRTSAGRFIPGNHRYEEPATIELASYLQQEPDFELHIRETLAHEMIHYWLWARRRPYGHTEEFYAKMKIMGARRWNPVPKKRPYKYLYECPGCRFIFKARRRLGRLACAKCCKAHNGGRFDERFQLYLAYDLARQPEARRLIEGE